ncbi:polyubiquitin-tagged protein recognition complex, Npl4 component [Violaceomyces palustris]|uniref:Polyubiquitin-tagged protein recognition complex, Npl4 component n=1 Tax=Violaceomyces palustris TaxID=1673888 RepID=A0ACD0P623_9BASI|nr:polyubiquitin-tagged protein recognition complex, Npl4 component [Violaceomyces palustris]
MLVRIRSKDGIFRFPLEPTDDASKLIDKFLETAINPDPLSLTFSNQPRGGEFQAETLRGTSLGELGISHGHLLYAAYNEASGASSDDATQAVPSSTGSAGPSGSTESPATNGSSTISKPKKPWEEAVEDGVDVYWQGKDGRIPRSRDSKFCRHGPKGMCDYCTPLEPYDSGYLSEHNIKHLSFHAYLRKQDIAGNKSSQSYIPPLEEASFEVKVPCPSGQHANWPAGVCTKCQPSAITLQRQPYRMVDHVEFAHPNLIENILAFWRSTAVQRFGFLLGRYEPYPDIPMGIKAVVEAIHEPPQEGELDGLTLGVPWDDQPRIEKLAKRCGLQFIGMIYSDLTPSDPTQQDASKAGMVVCKRHKESFFLSGCEAIFSAQLQLGNPSPSRFSLSGKYNSKFVTCVLSGTEEGAIDVSAYQVSEQAMGMVKADMIEASVNPNIIRVKPSEGDRFVPEVFYRYKNEYKIDVQESAKPTFPVEYLIVTATHGFPNSPNPTFLSSAFPIENRPGLHDQDLSIALNAIAKVVGGRDLLPLGSDSKGKGRAFEDDSAVRAKLVEVVSDWHMIAFLETCGILDEDDMAALCRVATTHDAGEALDSLLTRPGWQTLVAIAREHARPEVSSPANHGSSTREGSGTDQRKPEEVREENDFTYDGVDDSDEELDFDDANEAFDDDEDGNREPSRAAPASTREEVVIIPDDDVPEDARVCPHCTFHNPLGTTDCEVCGLPL